MKIAIIKTLAPVAALLAVITIPLSAQDQTVIQAAAPVSSSFSPDVPQSLDPLKQWRGQYGDDTAHTDVITTGEAWTKLWKHLSMPPHDALDEKTQMAVCIYFGQRPTTGFKPYIISAVERDGKMVISYSIGKPAPQAMVTQDTTHPWVVAIIPRTKLPVVFKEI